MRTISLYLTWAPSAIPEIVLWYFKACAHNDVPSICMSQLFQPEMCTVQSESEDCVNMLQGERADNLQQEN